MSVTGIVGYHPNHLSNVSTYRLGTHTSRRLQQVFDDTTGFEANYINCHASGTLYTVLNGIKNNTNDIEIDTTAINATLSTTLSSTNDIKDNTTLIASRTLLVKDELVTANVTLTAGNVLSTSANVLSTAGNVLLTAIESDIDSWTTRTFTMSGSQGNLMNAQACVSAGTTSSVIDWFGGVAVPKRVSVLVTATTSTSGNGFEIWGSADNIIWARIGFSNWMTVSNSAGASIPATAGVVIQNTVRYMKIIVYALFASCTATAIGLA